MDERERIPGPWPLMARDQHTQWIYEFHREFGASHEEAVAHMRGQGMPGVIGGDTNFWRGNWADQALPASYHQSAAAAGVSTTGKRYLGQLAKFPGDPAAWVSGVDDVAKRCRQEGWGCSGEVKVQGARYLPDPGPAQPYEPAPDLVEEAMLDAICANHDIGMGDLPALRQECKQQMMPDHPL